MYCPQWIKINCFYIMTAFVFYNYQLTLNVVGKSEKRGVEQLLERVDLLRWFLQHIVVVLCKAVLERCSHLHKQALTR